jgi:hypothetical protein
LDYIVDFPTCNSADSASLIEVGIKTIIGPYYNGLSDHDALMLTLSNPSHKPSKFGWVRIGRYYNDSSIREFKLNLSYENMENVSDSECDNDVNIIFNNFLNTYLRIFCTSFHLSK